MSTGRTQTQTIHALESVDRAVERLAVHLPSKTRLILTADHGHLDGPTHEILPTHPLVQHLRHEPWGDAREMHFSVNPGREEEFETEFRQKYGKFAFPIESRRGRMSGTSGPGTHQRSCSSSSRYASCYFARRRHVHIPRQVRLDEIHRVPLGPHAGRNAGTISGCLKGKRSTRGKRKCH